MDSSKPWRAEEERRRQPLAYRAAAEGEPAGLAGYAAVFDVETVIAGLFREVIRPGAFTEAIVRDDVRALFNHDPNYVLGRKPPGTNAGTLTLATDAVGLRYDVTLPGTTWAADLLRSIARGDISQSSFAFRVPAGGDTWTPGVGAAMPLREITAAELFDVSPVTYPAYADTTSAVRARVAAVRTRNRRSSATPKPGDPCGARTFWRSEVMTVQDLQSRAMKAATDARGLLEAADAKGEALNAEGVAAYERLMTAYDADRAEIDRRKRSDDAERAIASLGPVAGRAAAPVTNRERLASDEYRGAFWSAMRSGVPDEFRVLMVATDTAGGHTVPDEFRKSLIIALVQENVMRQLATVITTGAGIMTLPVLSTDASAAWTSEGNPYNESEPVFGAVTLNAYKETMLTRVSEELLHDSDFDLQAILIGQYARGLGNLEETAFVVGTGTGQPTGVVNGSTLGKTAAATNAILADELMDLFYALGRQYRAKASWLMHDTTIKAIRKLKTGVSGDNTFLWSPGLSSGEPDTLLGKPVYAAKDIATVATGNKAILFGDFSYYYIGDRAAIGMQRLNELYAANGNIGFRIHRRTDGKLSLPVAVQHLKLA